MKFYHSHNKKTTYKYFIIHLLNVIPSSVFENVKENIVKRYNNFSHILESFLCFRQQI